MITHKQLLNASPRWQVVSFEEFQKRLEEFSLVECVNLWIIGLRFGYEEHLETSTL